MNPIARIGVAARRGFGRWFPDPFVVAIAMTLAVMLAALTTGARPTDVLTAWGRSEGLWSLLGFAMQMTIMLVLGSALAAAPFVVSVLQRLASLAGGPRRLVGLTALVAIVLALLNWSLGLIGGALFAKEAGRHAARRGWRLHYPLLCAAGYSGLMVWHGGLSGSAPLKAASSADLVEVLGPDLAARVGAVPLDESLFGGLNLWVTGGLMVLGPILFMALTPREHEDAAAQPPPDVVLGVSPPMRLDGGEGGMAALERSAWFTWALAVPMAAALVLHFRQTGVAGLGFDTVNLSLFFLALVLHGRPDRFLAACDVGVRGCTGVILQFPLYAGIMAVMLTSGLSAALSSVIADAGREGLPLATFFSAGILNLFVPSGGGQWAVQGPIITAAAIELGVPVHDSVMAMAYGDQWTNMVQPFWALPLLAITGVRARDVVGYASIWMIAGGAWIVWNLVVHTG